MKLLLLCVSFIAHSVSFAKMSFVGRIEITDSGMENLSKQLQDAYLQETAAQFQGFLMQGKDVLLLPPDISGCSDEAIQGMSFKDAWKKCPGPPNYLRKNFKRRGLCNLDPIKPRAAQFHASKIRVAEFGILPGTIHCQDRACKFRFNLEKLTILTDGSIQDIDKNTLLEVSGLVFSLISRDNNKAYVDVDVSFDSSSHSFNDKVVLEDVRVVVPQNVTGFGFHSGHVVSMTGMQGLEALSSSERQGFSWPKVYELDSLNQYWLALKSFRKAHSTASNHETSANITGDVDTKKLLTAVVSLLNDLILTHPAWMLLIGQKISEGAKEFAESKFQAALADVNVAAGTKIDLPIFHMQDKLDASVHDQAITDLDAKLTRAWNLHKPYDGQRFGKLIGQNWKSYFSSMLDEAESIVKGMSGSHTANDVSKLDHVAELVRNMRHLASVKASHFKFENAKPYQRMFLIEGPTHIDSLKKKITTLSEEATLPVTVGLANDNVIEMQNPLQIQFVAEFDPTEQARRPAVDSNATEELGQFDLSVQISYEAMNRYLEMMQAHEQNPFQACIAISSDKTCRNGEAKGGFRVGGAPKISYDSHKNMLKLKIPKVQILKWKLGAVLPNAEQDMELEIGIERLESGSLHVFSSYSGKKQNTEDKSMVAFLQRNADPRLMLSRVFDNVIISMIMNFIDAQMKKGKQVDFAMLESMDKYGIQASKSKVVGLELLPDSIKIYLTLNATGLQELSSAAFGNNFKLLQATFILRKWLHRARQRIEAKKVGTKAKKEEEIHEEGTLDIAIDVD